MSIFTSLIGTRIGQITRIPQIPEIVQTPKISQIMDKEFKYGDITREILAAAFEVHKFFGNGFQEVIYQRALAIEFNEFKLNFQREIEQEIFYKKIKRPIGKRRADFIVEEKVLVELKAVSEINDVHWAQTLNYMKIYKLEVGLLINFGSKSLTFKRFVLS